VKPKVLWSASTKKSPLTDEDLMNWCRRFPNLDLRDLVSARVTLTSLMRSPPQGVGLDPAEHRGMIERAAKVSYDRRLPFWKVFEAVCMGLADGSY
jgi:hypothetical protein